VHNVKTVLSAALPHLATFVSILGAIAPLVGQGLGWSFETQVLILFVILALFFIIISKLNGERHVLKAKERDLEQAQKDLTTLGTWHRNYAEANEQLRNCGQEVVRARNELHAEESAFAKTSGIGAEARAKTKHIERLMDALQLAEDDRSHASLTVKELSSTIRAITGEYPLTGQAHSSPSVTTSK
jgi:hypothetical protein